MNPVHWLFFIGTVVVSLGFALYGQWVLWKYTAASYRTAVTGCEMARFVLDQAGLLQVPVTPIEPSEEYTSAEGLFLEPKVYEHHDFLSILQAARQAFLKSQLSNLTFWVRLKKRMFFVIRFTVLTGWVLLVLGYFVPGLRVLVNFGLGCFSVGQWWLNAWHRLRTHHLGEIIGLRRDPLRRFRNSNSHVSRYP